MAANSLQRTQTTLFDIYHGYYPIASYGNLSTVYTTIQSDLLFDRADNPEIALGPNVTVELGVIRVPVLPTRYFLFQMKHDGTLTDQEIDDYYYTKVLQKLGPGWTLSSQTIVLKETGASPSPNELAILDDASLTVYRAKGDSML